MRGGQAYGMVYPLITKADGTKFGKTESGAVWLDPERTSPYRFYQFWLNTDDRDVVKYLQVLHLPYPGGDRGAGGAAWPSGPRQREAQRALAREMTRASTARRALARAEQASQALFGGEIGGLSADEIADIFADVPSCELPKISWTATGCPSSTCW